MSRIAPLPVVNASVASTSDMASAMAMTDLNIDIDMSDEKWGKVNGRRRMKKKNKGKKLKDTDEDDAVDEDDSTSSTAEECTTPVSKCTHCTFSDQKLNDVCHETGRWQKFECIPKDESNSDEENPDPHYVMKSCKYTDFDEGVAMIRLQIFCLLIGSLSMISVRKQKRLFSSMFDRRKQGANGARSNATAGSSKRGSARIADDDEEIEFTPMTNQQREMTPLVESESVRMEII